MTGHEKIFKSGTGHSSGCRCSGNWSDDRWCFNGRNDHGIELIQRRIRQCCPADCKICKFKEAAGTNGEIYLVDGVSKLDLSIRTGELYLKEYNGNEIKVEVSGKHREKVRVGQEGDTLVLESIGRVQDREITVSYPKKTEFEEASVDVVAGTVNLDDNFYAKKLEVSVAAGEFTSESRAHCWHRKY